MSTIKVSNIQNASASSAAITLDANGQATLNGLNYPTAGPLSNRNLIVNGGMAVAQRGTQTTGVTTNGYVTDRFRFFAGSLGTWTLDQSTDAPAGFSKSAKMTCTTADASPAAGDYLFLQYSAEAQDLQRLAYGESAAEAATLSFYVKSNKTGSGSVDIWQRDNSNEQFVGTYTIISADTWERKTIAIPADTDGVINDDNGEGLRFRFYLNSGTSYSGGSTTTTWTTYAQTNSNISNLGVGGATSDYFAITGVQLEVGSVATPFEHRSFGDELARCQRYYAKSYDISVFPGAASSLGAETPSGFSNNSNNLVETIRFPVTMRAAPNMIGYSAADGTQGTWGYVRSGASGANTVTFDLLATSGCRCYLNIGAAWTGGSIEGQWTASAEL